MTESAFQRIRPKIEGNERLRLPQREGYAELKKHFASQAADREVGIILPVGCGKSGLIAIAPFATSAQRALVIAPNLNIADQLFRGADPTSDRFFLKTAAVIDGTDFPEPAEIRGTTANRADLDAADVVVTNIHQLQGSDNRWLGSLPDNFFDTILVDEAHHNVAASWTQLREKFPAARIVNFSATPARADGQVMAGKVIYSFPVARAMELGFVKRLRAVVLNPKTLRYVRREGDAEIEVGLDEVRRLGEEDAGFRRSIVTSKATLATIVDCSIRELERLRSETGERRLKIIASALNYEHCLQICEAYRARSRRADYVHSKEDGAANAKVHQKLERDELDVIIQVRKLGEGFDHPFLSVAAVFSVFSNLSPFVQFVGRVMRVIDKDKPDALVNRAVVVFHAGANVHRRWDDFKTFSEADQAYFDCLVSTDYVEPPMPGEIGTTPAQRPVNEVEIRGQGPVTTEVLALWKQDPRARKALQYLRSLGLTPEQIGEQAAVVPVPETKQKKRRAARSKLDGLIKTKVAEMLRRRGLNPEGRDLDRRHIGQTNFVAAKALVDRKASEMVNHLTGERSEWSQAELDRAEATLEELVKSAEKELLGG